MDQSTLDLILRVNPNISTEDLITLRAAVREPATGLEHLARAFAPNFDHTPSFAKHDTNDYSEIEKAVDEDYTPAKKVTVVVPTYNRADILRRNLAALCQQSYPHELMEVVIADDGSSDETKQMVRGMDLPFDVKYVWQEDDGYRLSRIRNEAIKRATHETIIILDVDMIPTPGFVREHMKWHHSAKNIGVIGHRRYVDPDDVTLELITTDPDALLTVEDTEHARLGITQDWRLQRYASSDNLKADPQPYLCFNGGNISFNKRLAFQIGLFDESFQFWGGEDAEFGNRLYRNGAFLIPELGAEALHLEHPVGDPAKRAEEKKKSRALLEQRIRGYEPDNFPAPKVSVFIPAYNRERYIAEAVESAIDQTLTDIEVVVCDDGSTDRTLEVLSKIQTRYNLPNQRPVLKVVKHQENKGIGAAWNSALRNCSGEYLLQLDGDDILHRSAAEKLARELDENPDIVCAYGNLRYVGDIERPGNGWNRPGFDRDYLQNTGMCVSAPRMFRAAAWFATEGANEETKNAVDYDAVLKLAEIGDFHHLEEVLYDYRWHGDQTTQKNRELQLRNARNAMDESRRRRSAEPKKSFYRVRETAELPADILATGVKEREAKQYEDAIDTFKQVLARDPGDTDALTNIGMAYRDLGDATIAIEYFTRALNCNPDHRFARRNLNALGLAPLELGAMQRAQKEYDAALDTFSRILSSDPNNLDAHINMGMIFRDTGQRGLARTYFGNALQINPNHQFARKNYEALSR